MSSAKNSVLRFLLCFILHAIVDVRRRVRTEPNWPQTEFKHGFGPNKNSYVAQCKLTSAFSPNKLQRYRTLTQNGLNLGIMGTQYTLIDIPWLSQQGSGKNSSLFFSPSINLKYERSTACWFEGERIWRLCSANVMPFGPILRLSWRYVGPMLRGYSWELNRLYNPFEKRWKHRILEQKKTQANA